MHYRDNSCRYYSVVESESSKASVKSVFSATESQIESAVENIRMVVTLDSYCFHLLGRGLEEILTTDLNLIRDSTVQYSAWSHPYKPDFPRILNCLTLVSAKL